MLPLKLVASEHPSPRDIRWQMRWLRGDAVPLPKSIRHLSPYVIRETILLYVPGYHPSIFNTPRVTECIVAA